MFESTLSYCTVAVTPKPLVIGALNCAPTILTKIALDFGFVILIASSLSFLGLGVQPPTPDLGSMVAEGARYLPDLWWLAIFPGLAILVAVIGFNLLGDGINDLLDIDR